MLEANATSKTSLNPVCGANRSTQVFEEEIDVLPVSELATDFQLTFSDLIGWLRD